MWFANAVFKTRTGIVFVFFGRCDGDRLNVGWLRDPDTLEANCIF